MAQLGRPINPNSSSSIRPMSFSPTLIFAPTCKPLHRTLQNAIQNNTRRTLTLSIKSTHKPINTRPSAVVSDTAALEAVEGVKEEATSWKYPFSNVVRKEKRSLFSGREWTARDVIKASVALSMHVLCLWAPFTFTWGALYVALTLVVFTGLGITFSYHRNLTHRSFKLPSWLEYFWAYCGCHALQGSPMTWVSIHRTHHLYTDREGDPHSPMEGFWFAQLNWIFDTKYFTNKQGGELSNVGDMDKQPFYKFIESTYIAHPIALAALLYALGGLPYLVWGMGVRSVFTTHTTYLVNSGLHIWGSRAYNTSDNSRNNWIMAFLTFGEGWHNNHHAFEYSARHGLEWWQIDMTWYLIKVFEFMGLATDIKLPTEAQKQKVASRNGSMSLGVQ